MLYQLDLILNYNQGWPFLDKNRPLGLLVTNIYKNRTIKISLFNYLVLGYILPITSVKEILVQLILLNLQSKLITYFL